LVLGVRARGAKAGNRPVDGLAITSCHAYMGTMTMPIDQTDYTVVVKNRAPPPKSWRWEIYRAGRTSPIERSSVYFQTMAAASRAGKEALKQLLDKLHAKHLRWPGGVTALEPSCG
jgi:hypothetical protein